MCTQVLVREGGTLCARINVCKGVYGRAKMYVARVKGAKND